MMSPYAFYQFWLNVEDVKVGELLRIFTFLDHEEIEELEQQTAEKPFLRAGQKALAEEVTSFVHGAEETERIKAASAALFGGGDLRALDADTLGAALREAGGRRGAARRRSCRRSSTCWSPPACPRAGARRAARSGRAAPTSTTSGSPTPSTARATTTWSRAAGWSCAAARRTSPAC